MPIRCHGPPGSLGGRRQRPLLDCHEEWPPCGIASAALTARFIITSSISLRGAWTGNSGPSTTASSSIVRKQLLEEGKDVADHLSQVHDLREWRVAPAEPISRRTSSAHALRELNLVQIVLRAVVLLRDLVLESWVYR